MFTINGFTARLKEPSTWAGLSILGLMFGLDPAKVAAVGQVASALVPFVHTDGGALAQAIIGLTTLGSAGAAVVMAEQPKTAAPAAPTAAPVPVAVQVPQAGPANLV